MGHQRWAGRTRARRAGIHYCWVCTLVESSHNPARVLFILSPVASTSENSPNMICAARYHFWTVDIETSRMIRERDLNQVY